MEITVLHNQSLFDIAIQHTGNVMNAFAIALENKISIGESLTSGRIISIPNVIVNSDILNYYKNKNINPGTKLKELMIGVKPLTGIGYWQIGETFEVQ